MNCNTVQNSLSDHLDGCLSDEERQDVVMHLNRCEKCGSRLREMERVQLALRTLPKKTVPESVAVALRVTASRERARVLARRTFEPLLWRARLWIDNLMRPLALPFAGGLASAVVLFWALLPTFAFRPIISGNDPPVRLFTEPAIKAQMPFSFDDDDVVVKVIVDGQGRMADYAVVEGPSLANNPVLRRLIERKLLFTDFTPATSFGSPTVGTLYISFQREHIDIKS
jgi:anti-sigma factor RsiW